MFLTTDSAKLCTTPSKTKYEKAQTVLLCEEKQFEAVARNCEVINISTDNRIMCEFTAFATQRLTETRAILA